AFGAPAPAQGFRFLSPAEVPKAPTKPKRVKGAKRTKKAKKSGSESESDSDDSSESGSDDEESDSSDLGSFESAEEADSLEIDSNGKGVAVVDLSELANPPQESQVQAFQQPAGPNPIQQPAVFNPFRPTTPAVQQQQLGGIVLLPTSPIPGSIFGQTPAGNIQQLPPVLQSPFQPQAPQFQPRVPQFQPQAPVFQPQAQAPQFHPQPQPHHPPP